MRTFEFVKVGKVWFYRWSDYDKGGSSNDRWSRQAFGFPRW